MSIRQRRHIRGLVPGSNPKSTNILRGVSFLLVAFILLANFFVLPTHSAFAQEGLSGPDGVYSLQGVEEGLHRVEAAAPAQFDGCLRAAGAVLSEEILVNGAPTPVRSDLFANGFGTVLGAIPADVAQAGDVVVTLKGLSQGSTEIARTDVSPSGEFMLSCLAAGEYSVSLQQRNADEASSGQPAIGAPQVRVRVHPGKTTEIAESMLATTLPGVAVLVTSHVSHAPPTDGQPALLANNAHITGVVTGVGPLNAVYVEAHRWNDANGDWEYVGYASPDASGVYDIGGLPAGDYRVRFYEANGALASEWQNDKPDLESADTIALAAGATVSGINAVLAQASHITGVVTGAGAGPLGSGYVEAYRWNDTNGYWANIGYAYTDANGVYEINGLPAGDYRVQFSDNNEFFFTEWYNDKPAFESADTIVVAALATVPDIDAELPQASHITGVVTGAGAGPLDSAYAIAFRWNSVDGYWQTYNWANTDASGVYEIGRLPAGNYRVWFYDNNGAFADEWYNNKPNLERADTIAVPAGATVPGIDADLTQSSHIIGVVTGVGAGPLESGYVEAYRWDNSDDDWVYAGDASTDASGTYDIGGLPAGDYRVRFYENNGAFASEWYNNRPDLESADTVVVAEEATVSGIDAELAQASHITGVVTGAGAGPLDSGYVEAYRWNEANGYWANIGYSYTDASGAYDIGGLPAGDYRVRFSVNNEDFFTEWYNDKPDLESADTIAVAALATVPGIDAELAQASHITGVVTGAGVGPLDSVYAVAVRWNSVDGSWQSYNWANTDASGTYDIGALPDGDYRVWFYDDNEDFADEWYNDKPDLESADTILVPALATVPGINAELAQASHITGVVTGAGVGPLDSGYIQAYLWDDANGDWDFAGYAYTDASGAYDIGGLPAGDYRVRFSDNNGDFFSEWYDDKPDLESADKIVVPAMATIPGIDAELAQASHITGVVTGAGVGPLDSVNVVAYRWDNASDDWNYITTANTDASGVYDIGGLSAGDYRVWFYDYNGAFFAEWYHDKPDLESADTILVPALATVPGINAELAQGSQITGVVTGAGAGPLDSVYVESYRWDNSNSYWANIGYANTDASGNYVIGELPAGDYRLRFYDNNRAFLGEWYSDKPDLESADTIAVSAGVIVSGIDTELAQASHITGVVTGAGAGPLDSSYVEAYLWDNASGDWNYVATASTDASGVYDIDGLPAGDYRVRFSDNNGAFQGEWYNDKPDMESADTIIVAAEATVSGMNAELALVGSATPTATPVTPSATPVTPTATPVTPTATPVTPTATPETPTATPVTPSATPVTPSATPVTPTSTPVTPSATPEPPTSTPVPPTATPVTPTATPVTPSATPIPPIAVVDLVPGASATVVATLASGSVIALDVPAGAVEHPMQLEIRNEDNPSVGRGFMLGGAVFDIRAMQHGAEVPSFVFAQPVMLTLTYTDDDIAGLVEEDLRLRYFDPVSQLWKEDGITIIERNSETNTLKVSIAHLTQFGIGVVQMSSYLPLVQQ